MIRVASLLLLLLSLPARAQDAPPPITLVHAGTLLATPGVPPLSKQTVVVQGNRIVEIRAGFVPLDQVKGATKLIDLSEQFVLPGLSDVHMHLSGMQDMDLNLQAVTVP